MFFPCEDYKTERESQILDVIAFALAKAGYRILDGDKKSIIIRHSKSDSDYEITIKEIAP